MASKAVRFTECSISGDFIYATSETVDARKPTLPKLAFVLTLELGQTNLRKDGCFINETLELHLNTVFIVIELINYHHYCLVR